MAKEKEPYSKSVYYYLTVRHYSQYGAFAFLGAVVWTITYLLFATYKEILICYLRRNEKFVGRGFYYKYIEYKPHIKNLYMFNGAIALFWACIIFILKDWRYYIITVGFYIFFSGYVIGWVTYYVRHPYEKDYFDEIKWIIGYIKENMPIRGKVKKD